MLVSISNFSHMTPNVNVYELFISERNYKQMLKITLSIFLQGHPLFAEQMASALVDIYMKSSEAQEGENRPSNITLNLHQFSFSHSMEALIASRVDLLEPKQALTLKVE